MCVHIPEMKAANPQAPFFYQLRKRNSLYLEWIIKANLFQGKARVGFGRCLAFVFSNHPSVFQGFTAFISQCCSPLAGKKEYTRTWKRLQAQTSERQHFPHPHCYLISLPLPVSCLAPLPQRKGKLITPKQGRRDVPELLVMFRYLPASPAYRQLTSQPERAGGRKTPN